MPRNKFLLDNPVLEHKNIVRNPQDNITPNRIRIIRLINNMDIKELSAKLNISTSMLQQIETQQKQPSVNTLILLSDIFDISIDYILYRSNEIEPRNKNYELKTNLKELKEYCSKEDKQC
jgi:transcriptional regulator with XRE-family HTH domain